MTPSKQDLKYCFYFIRQGGMNCDGNKIIKITKVINILCYVRGEVHLLVVKPRGEKIDQLQESLLLSV